MTDFLLIDGKEFRRIEGYEDRYAVSKDGCVYSIQRVDDKKVPRGGHFMKLRVCPRHGYVTVKLCSGNGRYRLHKLHLLVLNAFGSEKPFENAVCRHLDDVKTNNHIENLEWGTSKDNKADAIRNGCVALGERNGGGGKLTEGNVRRIKAMISENHLSHKEIGDLFGVSGVMIGRIAADKSWRHVK